MFYVERRRNEVKRYISKNISQNGVKETNDVIGYENAHHGGVGNGIGHDMKHRRSRPYQEISLRCQQ